MREVYIVHDGDLGGEVGAGWEKEVRKEDIMSQAYG